MANLAPTADPPVSFTFINSDPLTGITGDPKNPAVWFWNVNQRGDAIYRLNSSGHVRSWAVLTGKKRVIPGLQAGLAVGPAGDVWLGVGRTLVRLDPVMGVVRTWTVPVGRRNPRAARSFPQAIPPSITAVVVGPSGHVAVALYPRSSVTTLDPSTSRFAVVDLPSVDNLETALAYIGDDTLGVGFADLDHGGDADHVLLIAGRHRHSAVVPASTAYELTGFGSTHFVAGGIHPELLSVAGRATALPAPTSLMGTDLSNQPLDLLSNDRLAGQTGTAVVVFPANAPSDAAATTHSVLFRTPKEPGFVGPSSPPATTSTTLTTIAAASTRTATACREPVAAMATDGHDDIWIVTGDNDDTVLRLAALDQ